MFIRNTPVVVARAYSFRFEVLKHYKSFAEQYGMELVVLIFPRRFQVQEEHWVATIERYRLIDSKFDLMLPSKKLGQFCDREGIACIDPTEQRKDSHASHEVDLYFPAEDMRWNRYGR